LRLLPLSQRVHDVSADEIMETEADIPYYEHPALESICNAVIDARRRNAAVIMMYGAHVIRTGCSKFMIRLMKEGLITHFATNGAGAIHDFEMSMIGATCESVEKYIREGQFGLWTETGRINDAVNASSHEGLGFGESVGKYISESGFPFAGISVLAEGYKNRIPVTVHVGIGNDIVHEHPNCDGAAVGKASYTDFLIFAKSMENLEHGVFLNFGSAVTGPEVYLKCLSMVRNAAKQEGRKITDFTTAVFDIQPLGNDYRHAPPKTNPYYYFRPWKTILARTVADGGRSYYVQGDHRAAFGNLAGKLLSGRGDTL